MKKQKQRNPLRRRVMRELRDELGKYIVIFLLLTLTISMVSGFLVAAGSMSQAYDESFETYNIEDGHFTTARQLSRAQRKAVQELGITVYDLNYVEQPLADNRTMRIFADRTEVNRVCVMKGTLPTAADEIAIDRMYADNNALSIGDTITSADGAHIWRITGLVALSDYSALFQDNNDTMFDSVQFGVAIVTPEGFDALGTDHINWCYAWKYAAPPASETAQKRCASKFRARSRRWTWAHTFSACCARKCPPRLRRRRSRHRPSPRAPTRSIASAAAAARTTLTPTPATITPAARRI